jgi:FkbM family methyltransferase
MNQRWLFKLPNYCARFGVSNGIRLSAQIERRAGTSPTDVRPYRVPGLPAPIYLRDSRSDHATFWQCLVQCQYDFRRFPQSARIRDAYRQSVKAGKRPLIVDCGGNIGLAALWFAMEFPECIVYSIEPDGENMRMLRMNVACLGDRVIPLHGAIWNESGTLHISNPDSGAAAFRVAAGGNPSTEPVPAYTIGQICDLAGVEAAFIVKLDIEGAQAQLFRSNTDWVQRTHLITLELDDWMMPWQGTSRPFFSCLSQHPFDYLLGGESIFCFRDFEATL